MQYTTYNLLCSVYTCYRVLYILWYRRRQNQRSLCCWLFQVQKPMSNKIPFYTSISMFVNFLFLFVLNMYLNAYIYKWLYLWMKKHIPYIENTYQTFVWHFVLKNGILLFLRSSMLWFGQSIRHCSSIIYKFYIGDYQHIRFYSKQDK